MREVRASAPGKVNLTLRVGAPTPDGYHPLVTVFEALNLRETVTVRTSKTPGVRVETVAYLPDGSVDEVTTRAMADVDPATHLAVRAARVLQRLAAAGPWASTAAGLSIRVDKRVPVAGGMAGGSADAAAALVACNELWELGLGSEQLQAIGRSLGADVPACLAGGIALGTGRGDHMSVLREGDEEGHHHWVMLLSREGLSTPEVFREFDRVNAAGAPAMAEPTPEEVAALCGDPRNWATASSMICRRPPCACVPSWPRLSVPRRTREHWPLRCPDPARPSRPSRAMPSTLVRSRPP